MDELIQTVDVRDNVHASRTCRVYRANIHTNEIPIDKLLSSLLYKGYSCGARIAVRARSPVYFHLFFLRIFQNLDQQPHLLLTSTLEEAARLGVEELVAISIRYQHAFSLSHVEFPANKGPILPLNSPVHGSIGNKEGGHNVEDLVAETAEAVEDGSVEGTGKGTLAVGRERVGGNALGGRAA